MPCWANPILFLQDKTMNQDHIDITPFRATLLFSRPAASLATEAPVVKAALRAPPPRGRG